MEHITNNISRGGVSQVLETCTSLSDCEHILRRELGGKVNFIGELELSCDDVQRLNGFITQMSHHSHNLTLLIEKAQASTATFLVWQGILGYEEGDYWSSVHQVIGRKDPVLQSRLGESFIVFLDAVQLPNPPLPPDALRFVAPILLHGGIPPQPPCSLLRRGHFRFVRIRYYGPEEIKDYLASLRSDEQKRTDLSQRLFNVQQKEFRGAAKGWEVCAD